MIKVKYKGKTIGEVDESLSSSDQCRNFSYNAYISDHSADCVDSQEDAIQAVIEDHVEELMNLRHEYARIGKLLRKWTPKKSKPFKCKCQWCT